MCVTLALFEFGGMLTVVPSENRPEMLPGDQGAVFGMRTISGSGSWTLFAGACAPTREPHRLGR